MNKIFLLVLPLLGGCSDLAQAAQYTAAGRVGVAQANANGAIGVAQWNAAAASSVANAQSMRDVTVASIWAGNVQLLILLIFVAVAAVMAYRVLALYYRNRGAVVADVQRVLPGQQPVRILPPTPKQIEAMADRAAQIGGTLQQSRDSGDWFVFIDNVPVKRLTVKVAK